MVASIVQIKVITPFDVGQLNNVRRFRLPKRRFTGFVRNKTRYMRSLIIVLMLMWPDVATTKPETN